MADAIEETKKEEQEERKGSGLLIGFLRKLGLSPAPRVATQGVGVGAAGPGGEALIAVRGLGVPQTGFFGTLLATKAGVVALILSATSIAAGVGAMGRGVFLSSPRAPGGSQQLWAALPLRAAQGPAEASPPGPAGSSLDYMAEAAKGDDWLRKMTGAPEEVPPATAAKPPNAVEPPDHGAPPAAPALRDSVGPKATMAKLQGLAGQSSGGSGGAFGKLGAPARASELPDAAKVYGLTAMRRDKTAAGMGRRPLVGSRGMRTSDALRFANRDGLAQKGARNPSMAQAGTTFDGAGSTIQGSPAGVPAAGSFGGVQDQPKTRLSPNNVLDQKDVPSPPPPGETKDKTPYKWAMWVAIAGLLGAMLLQKLAGSKKEEANRITGTTPPELAMKAQLLAAAATLHWMAAAAAGLAAAMGGIMLQKYDQKMQGIMFIASGGLLALWNIKSAMDLSKGAKEAEKAAEDAKAKMDAPKADINDKLTGEFDGSGKPEQQINPGGGGGDSGGSPMMPPMNGADAGKDAAKDKAKDAIRNQGTQRTTPPPPTSGGGDPPEFNF